MHTELKQAMKLLLLLLLVAPVQAAWVTVSPTAATLGAGQAQQFKATVNGGQAAVQWSTVNGTVTSTGLYTAPSVVVNGATVYVVAKIFVGNSTAAAYALVTFKSTAVAITTASLPNGVADIAYAATTLVATGGTPPYVWSVTSGALPAGLTLSATGALSGTPTSAGSCTFAIQAVDSAGAKASHSYSLTVFHSVWLSWTASVSANVVGYLVYRSAQSGGPYAQYTSSLIAGTTYVDVVVQSGVYYYVVVAVDSSNDESSYSNEAEAVVL